MYCGYIFFLMILCHIIDDFVFQPICLSKLKQKKYWESECKKHNIDITPYKNDYYMALGIHALSWSIMITLPFIFYGLLISMPVYIFFVLGNTIVHGIVDDIKANDLKMNLITDQCVHLLQICVTWYVFILNIYNNLP